jgi:hypothetical protein
VRREDDVGRGRGVDGAELVADAAEVGDDDVDSDAGVLRFWSTQMVNVGPAAFAAWMLPAIAARKPAATTTRSASRRVLDLMLDPPLLRE